MKFLCYLFCFLITFGPVRTTFGQAAGRVLLPAQGGQVPVPMNRGFGAKDSFSGAGFLGGGGTDVSLPQGASLPEHQIFPEQAQGGLTYQVHILGEINAPGTYRMPASTRLSEAISRAGGILSRGSMRFIEIRRQHGGGRKVDLLDFKLFGNLDANPYLLDNDILFIPLIGKVVQVAGAVNRPAVYELKNEKTLEDVIQLAGGLAPGAGNPVPLKVVRYTHGKREVIDVADNKESRSSFIMEGSDVVVVPHFLTQDKDFDYNIGGLPGDPPIFYPSYEERVFVIGAVDQPGPQPYSPYYDVRHYLTLAGGMTKMAKHRKLRIISSLGKEQKATRTTSLNPGDTIVVPEKYMGPENYTSLVLSITTSILGITTTVLTLTR